MSDFNYQEYLRNNPLLKEEVKDQLITESQEVETVAEDDKEKEKPANLSQSSSLIGRMGDKSFKEEDEEITEGNLDDLQKLMQNLSDALLAFKKKAEELKLDADSGDATQAVNYYIEDVFKANMERTGGQIDESAEITEEETLNEGVFDKVKEKVLKVADKIKNKFSADEIAKMKDAVKKALGKDKLELSDITLDNLKKVVNVMKDQLAEGQLEESLGDKIKKALAGTGMLGGLAAAIVGGAIGTLSAPLVIGGLIAMIIGGIISANLDEEITEETTSKMKVSELKAKIKEDILSVLSEAEEEVDVDVDVEDEVEVDAEADDIEIERPGVKTTVDVGLSPEEEIVQDSLKAAMDAANELGNQKLADQIGNTITFFTREFVVGQNTD